MLEMTTTGKSPAWREQILQKYRNLWQKKLGIAVSIAINEQKMANINNEMAKIENQIKELEQSQ
jgi:hypothetical protein